MEATLEAITFDELVGIQDMGAAGLTSSSSEMAAKGGRLHLRLEQVPTRARYFSLRNDAFRNSRTYVTSC